MAKVVHAVDVEIQGELDPSLAKAIGLTEAQFKRLESASKTFNSLMSKTVAQMPRDVVAATEKIDGALNKVGSHSDGVARKMAGNFHKVAEEAHKAAEKIHKSMAGAFDRIAESALHLTGIGGLAGGVLSAFAGEEFIRGAFETRAERGVLQNQMRTLAESQGHPGLDKEVDTLIRNMEGRETPLRYDAMMKTASLLMSAAPERFGDIESVHGKLKQLADVSRDPEAFGMVSQAYTRILAEGKVDAQHLNEMSIDTGFAFKKAMADALKVTPEELSEMLKKHKLSGKAQIDALNAAMDLITGPGGAAYQHAEAQLQGLKGIQERFLGHWTDFQESFGIQLENFISPIADKVFSILTPAALTHAFDGLTNYVKGFASAVAALIDKLQHGAAAEHLQAIGNALGNMFTKAFGGGNFADFFKEVQDPINGIHTVMTAAGEKWVDMLSGKWADGIVKTLEAIQKTVAFIQDHFETIKNSIIAIIGVLAAAKVAEVGKNVIDLAKGIWSIAQGTVYIAEGNVVSGAGVGTGAAGTALTGLARAGIGTGMIFGQAAIADTMRPMELGFLQRLGASADNAAKILDGTFAKISWLDGKFGGFGTALDNTIQSLAGMAAKIIALPFAGMANSIAQFSAAVGSAMSATSAAEAAAKTYSHAPGAAMPSAVPAPTPHASGGIFTRPHIGLVAERGPEAIIPLGRGGGLGHSVTVNAPITVNGGDRSLESVLSNHAEAIARAVEKALADHQMRMATV